MPNDLKPDYEFHHLGYACKNLDKEKVFFSALGYQQEDVEFEDTYQGVRGCFMYKTGSSRIELLENLPTSSTLTPWLEQGITMYHLAYQVDDMDAALNWARQQRGKVISKPCPAVAFAGKAVCFVMFRPNNLLEFIQK